MSLPSVAPPTPQTPEPTPRHSNPNTPHPLDHIPHLDLSMSPNTFKDPLLNNTGVKIFFCFFRILKPPSSLKILYPTDEILT